MICFDRKMILKQKGGISMAEKGRRFKPDDYEPEKEERTSPDEKADETDDLFDINQLVEEDDHAPEESAEKADEYDEFQAIDVSEPRAPVREMDIIEEALAIRRRDWIKTHLSYIYAVIGVILVAVIVFVIYMYFQGSNPMSRFVGSLSKDFSTSFDYDISVTENKAPVMHYVGSIDVDRSSHAVEAVYQADYNRYSYTGAAYGNDKSAVKGSYYNNKWTIRDCTDNAQDFFDFDRDFRAGGFDSGSFLRFTGLTSDYSTREMDKMMSVIKSRLSTNSPIATITTEKDADGTRYHYDIDVYKVFELIKDNGASVFYRATDYDKFVASFEANKAIVESAKCTIDFTVDPAGYMTFLEVTVISEGKSYGLTCTMSNFGEAKVELPEGFLRAAEIVLPEE